MTEPTAIRWLEWDTAAFRLAEEKRQPVLLSITARWCHWCAVMDRTVFTDPRVAAIIRERFVPVRVDADRRPDVSERYNLGGWPTTIFLTPAGDVLTGATYLPADRLEGLLRQVSEAYAARRDEIDAKAATTGSNRRAETPAVRVTPRDPARGAGPDADAVDRLRTLIVDSFDERCGGLGAEPKLPHAAALALAIELWRRDPEDVLRHVVTRSLDAIGWGGLYDTIDGGFFRYATTRDWSLPHTEKLLEVNASLASLFLDAYAAFDHVPYRDRAAAVIRFVHVTLADPEGGFYGSQKADAGYYALADHASRRAVPPPPIDRSRFVDGNALMVSTCLDAARILGDDSLGASAINGFDRLMAATYRPGAGVAHYHDGQPHEWGLLADQVRAARALVDAHAVSERAPYLMLAEELMRFCLRELWDREAGGFFDRSPDGAGAVGLLRRRLKPLALNAEAAEVLVDLGRAIGDEALVARAGETLAAVAPSVEAHGLFAAPYARAVLRWRSIA